MPLDDGNEPARAERRAGTGVGASGQIATNRVVTNPQLVRAQKVHAIAVFVLGLGGILLAAALAIWVQPVTGFDVGILAAGYLLTGFGLTIGFHRMLTHRSFKAVRPLRNVLTVLGSAAGQGSPLFWTALHRLHHEYSDREGDPHSPNLMGKDFLSRLRGFGHAYFAWSFDHPAPNPNFYCKDLLRERDISYINTRYLKIVGLGMLIPAVLGGLYYGTLVGALVGLCWGGLIRMFLVHNMVWWITSFTHVIGARDYESNDLSRNLWVLAIPTLGESWHNNHHAFPAAPNLQFRWWQIDFSGMLIALFARLGWVSDLRTPSQAALLQSRRK